MRRLEILRVAPSVEAMLRTDPGQGSSGRRLLHPKLFPGEEQADINGGDHDERGEYCKLVHGRIPWKARANRVAPRREATAPARGLFGILEQ